MNTPESLTASSRLTLRTDSAVAFPSAPAKINPGQLPLGQELMFAGLVSEADLEKALAEHRRSGRTLGEVLVEQGAIDEENLLPFLEARVGVPAIRLRDGLIDPAVVQEIPRPVARRLRVLALFRVRDTISVAMAEPQNLDQIDEIERVTGHVVRPVFALPSAIEKLLKRAYESDFGVDTVTADFDTDSVTVESDAIEIDAQSAGSMADGSPIISLVNYMIVQAVRQKASDIHVEPGMKSSTVRFRVDGVLRDVMRPRREFHPAIVSRLKVMARLDIAEHRLPQDGRIHVAVEGREIDLRVSTLPTVRGEKVVLRVLDRRNLTFNLNDLGIPDHLLVKMREMLDKPYGLLLVTGPTGSGKTTTLYSALELVKSVERNIVTVEDPVEYQLELINQIQVGGAAKKMDFGAALRSILRQDPDIIMVGEVRDHETAEIAIQAALTGHLVLSTLHTNDAPGAVTRLQDMGIASFKIAAALVGVIAQRLVRKVCPACRTPYFPPSELLRSINYTGDIRRQFVRGEGCRECFDSGCQGRIGVYEVMPSTRELRRMITADADQQRLRDTHLESGGTTLLQEGIRLAEAGITSLEEVLRVAQVE